MVQCCNQEQTFFLVTFVCYVLAVRLLWFSILLKPFKLWTTFMHEFSHAIGAWITCNKVTGIEVNENEGGLCHWTGRVDRMQMSKHVVLPAGYLGSTLWGTLILLSCARRDWSHIMSFVLIAALVVCLLYALFGKTHEERRPLILVSVGFGVSLGVLLLMSYTTSNPGWDIALDAVLLWIGTLNAMFATQDIYDDTIIRTDARSDAFKFAELHPNLLSPKCVGGTWFVLALAAFGFAVYYYLVLEVSSVAALSWWVFAPGPLALATAVLHRTYILHKAANGHFSLSFCLVNLVPRAAKRTAVTTVDVKPAGAGAPGGGRV